MAVAVGVSYRLQVTSDMLQVTNDMSLKMPKQLGIGDTIRTCREIQCLLYARFFIDA